MACFRPLTGYKSRVINPSGKRSIVFNPREGLLDQPVTLPCGQCRFCRLEHSRQWAVRALHEAEMYAQNCFITLTYDDDHLPKNGSLDYEAPVLFMKRLRDKFGPDIRSYGCAEYGEKYARPHYHICLFNHDFQDKKPWKKSNGHQLYTSLSLAELWDKGFCTVADLTFETAAYTARYVTKKLTGPRAKAYEVFDSSTGEFRSIQPERAICVSRRPGLGKSWYDKFGEYTRHHDFHIIRGKRVRPAKYYDRLFDIAYPEQSKLTKQIRKEKAKLAKEKTDDIDESARQIWKQKCQEGEYKQSPEPRLYVEEKLQEIKYKQLKRSYENG